MIKNKSDLSKKIDTIFIIIIILLVILSIPFGIIISEDINKIQSSEPTSEDIWQ